MQFSSKMETVFATAFFLGLLSACSLPLGAITATFWRPGDRVTAILMAFGGGALLAALTIDLVASSVETGHFNALALGAVLGGLLFIGLNQVVNDYGGFLRKASTTIYHLRRKQHQRIRRIAGQMKRVNLFHDLDTKDFKAIASSIRTENFRPGTPIYRAGDPADALYIVAEGVVDMFDHRHDMERIDEFHQYEVFGWRACITGSPAGATTVARNAVTVWAIPKRTLDALILNSPTFLQVVHRLLRAPGMLDYLLRHQGMEPKQAEDWLNLAAQDLNKRGAVPQALRVARHADDFIEQNSRVRRFSLVQGLPQEELAFISAHLLYKRYARGETIYHQRDGADRMFFIDSGEVQLINPLESRARPSVLRDGDAFGGLSFLTGALRSSTAVAVADTRVWELRRGDLEDVFADAPEFARRMRDYVQTRNVSEYLNRCHGFETDRVERWARQAVKSIESGKLMPAAADASLEIKENHGAPLAIWLGITLDGIPESLVIGASLIESSVSYSLIAGLFLSNYPEALSSSTGMRQQGMSHGRILFMWVSLMLLTGLGAALGSQFFADAGPTAFALVEGLAAGAMLTMIAETMLPEAYFKGGSVVGMSTLMGFLVAIFFKTLE